MPQRERWQAIQDILKDLRGLDPLKRLFWSELNYDHVNQPLSRRGWSDAADDALAENPVLFAAHQDFHILYARLNSDRLLLGQERPVVSRLLQDHPYALFVFSNAPQDHWHIVNVKMADDPKKRRLFRRFTIGPTERLRTTSERIALLDVGDRKHSPLQVQELHDDAFNVEAVTKQFFATFAELYHKVADDIREVRGLEEQAGRLAQLLLDRLIFLYFIQKKAWLDGKPDYLYARFLDIWKKTPRGSNYYSDVLYPLFLCLSDADVKIDSVGAVPFLNGGLFEESVRQAQAKRLALARISIKNVTFRAIFDDLLERFNFTITEVTPLDVEVAIDPEMLGKIFESLILELEKDPDKDLRRLTGSYYTPRPIVHFMCREALKEYLVIQLADEDGPKTENVPAKIETLLDLPQADQLDEEQTSTLNQLLTTLEAKALRGAILLCRVCDPAVGSGAFPVGMLHEMVAAIGRLDVRLGGPKAIQKRNYDYGLKKEIIESCLYGVDIQEQAVRLCELRLWLSLVVDYQIDPDKPFAEAIREVPNLPNLSYRIMRGDSLLERLFGHVAQLDEMARDEKVLDLIDAVQRDKQAYFSEGNTAEKRRLELKILVKQAGLAERLIEAKRSAVKGYQASMFGEGELSAKERKARAEHGAQLNDLDDLKKKVALSKERLERLARQKTAPSATSLDALRRRYFQTGDAPTFIWRVDFAEAFVNNGGFDITIGNPPYGIVFDETKKHLLTRSYPSFVRNNDTFAAFADLSAHLLNVSATSVLITPNTYLVGPYFEQLKKQLLVSGRPIRIIDFGTQRVFPDPNVFTAILIYRTLPRSPKPSLPEDSLVLDTAGDIGAAELAIVSSSEVPRWGEPPFLWATTSSLEQRIADQAQDLSQWYEVKDVGFNYWTVGRGKTRGGSIGSRILYSGPRETPKDRPFIKGADIAPFRIAKGTHFLRYNYESFLAPHRDMFRFTPSYLERIPKIVYRQTSDRIVAAIDREARYTDKTVHLVVAKAQLDPPCSYEYLVGLLNSDLITYVYRQRAREEGRLFAQVKVFRVKALPIIIGTREQQKHLEQIVRRLEDDRPGGPSRQSLATALNQLVYEIYGLREDESNIIQSQSDVSTRDGERA